MKKWMEPYTGLGMLIFLQIIVTLVLFMSLNVSGDKVSFAYIPTLFLLFVISALVGTFRAQNLRLKKIEEELAQLKRSQDN